MNIGLRMLLIILKDKIKAFNDIVGICLSQRVKYLNGQNFGIIGYSRNTCSVIGFRGNNTGNMRSVRVLNDIFFRIIKGIKHNNIIVSVTKIIIIQVLVIEAESVIQNGYGNASFRFHQIPCLVSINGIQHPLLCTVRIVDGDRLRRNFLRFRLRFRNYILCLG